MGLVTNSSTGTTLPLPIGPNLNVVKQILPPFRYQIKFFKVLPKLIAIANHNTKLPYAVTKAVSVVSVFKAVLRILLHCYMFRLLPINNHYMNER
jgi:hypothetical protein